MTDVVVLRVDLAAGPNLSLSLAGSVWPLDRHHLGPPPPPPAPPPALLVMVGVDDVDEVVLGLTSVVMPAGLVFRLTFFVLGNLLSFLYFIRLF